jgi:hypothetical protein
MPIAHNPDPFERAMLLRCYRSHLRGSHATWRWSSKLTDLKLAANCRRKLLGLRPTIEDYDYAPVEADGSLWRMESFFDRSSGSHPALAGVDV